MPVAMRCLRSALWCCLSGRAATLLVWGVGLLLAALPRPASAGYPGLLWREPQAEVRLLAYPGGNGGDHLRVDLPPAWRGKYVDVSASDADGNALTCRAVRLGTLLVAAEVDLPAAAQLSARTRATRGKWLAATEVSPLELLRQAVQVYLWTKPRPAGATAGPRWPVDVRAHTEIIKARPLTCREMVNYLRKQPTVFQHRDLANFLDDAAMEQVQALKPPRGESTMRFQVVSELIVPTAADYQFAVNQGNTGPWFLFVDGQALSSWGEATVVPAERRLLAPVLHLEVGLHRLDFIGLSDRSQAMPELNVRVGTTTQAYDNLPPTLLTWAASPIGLATDTKDGTAVTGALLAPQMAMACIDTPSVVRPVGVLDLSWYCSHDRLKTSTVSLDGQVLAGTAPSYDLAMPERQVHQVAAQAEDLQGKTAVLAFELGVDWTQAQALDATFKPGPLPLLEPRNGTLALAYRVEYGDAAAAFMSAYAQMQVVLRDDHDQVLSSSNTALPATPLARHSDLPLPAQPGWRVEQMLAAGGLPLAPPLRVRQVLPSATDLTFTPADDRLRYRDGYAVLARPPTSGPTPVRPDHPVRQVLLVDDEIAAVSHLTENLALAPYVAAHWSWTLNHQPLNHSHLQGQGAILEKYLALGPALGSSADAIVWAVGHAEIAAGVDVVDYRDQLAFLVEACLSHGKLPILVTPAVRLPLRAVDLRPYALTVMELGARYQIPVVDYYSASLLEGGVDRFYQLAGRTDLRSATPDAAGRTWYLQRLAAAIATCNRQLDEGTP